MQNASQNGHDEHAVANARARQRASRACALDSFRAVAKPTPRAFPPAAAAQGCGRQRAYAVTVDAVLQLTTTTTPVSQCSATTSHEGDVTAVLRLERQPTGLLWQGRDAMAASRRQCNAAPTRGATRCRSTLALIPNSSRRGGGQALHCLPPARHLRVRVTRAGCPALTPPRPVKVLSRHLRRVRGERFYKGAVRTARPLRGGGRGVRVERAPGTAETGGEGRGSARAQAG